MDQNLKATRTMSKTPGVCRNRCQISLETSSEDRKHWSTTAALFITCSMVGREKTKNECELIDKVAKTV